MTAGGAVTQTAELAPGLGADGIAADLVTGRPAPGDLPAGPAGDDGTG